MFPPLFVDQRKHPTRSALSLAALLIGIAIFHVAHAADVRVESDYFASIVLEGDIVPGDYERFVEAVLNAGPSHSNVVLASKGGDAREAIRIGNFIRALKYSTEAPRFFSAKTWCQQSIDLQNCTCESACALIYLSGVQRTGDVVGVHRIYLDPSVTSTISLKESEIITRTLEEVTRAYLKSVGTPSDLIDKTLRAGPDSLEMLPLDYVHSHLHRYSRDVEDWLFARCGGLARSMTKGRSYPSIKAALSAVELQEFDREYDRRLSCEIAELGKEIWRAWWLAVRSAIQETRAEHVQPGSNLDVLRKANAFDLRDIPGMRGEDAISLLLATGSGLAAIEFFVSAWGYEFPLLSNLKLSINGEGVLEHLVLDFPESATSDGYIGYFVEGLSSTSSPVEFVGVLGEPESSGCYKEGWCMLVFESERHYVFARFTEEGHRLISITFASQSSRSNPYNKVIDRMNRTHDFDYTSRGAR